MTLPTAYPNTTGSFTDLSVSGTVTLSGGTANGIVYLNGSKVATTGASSLSFNGTNMGIGIAAASADGTLHVHTASAGTVTAISTANSLVIETNATGGASILVPNAEVGNFYFGHPANTAFSRLSSDYTNNRMTIGTGRAGATLRLNSDDVVPAVDFTGASGSELAAFAGNVTASGSLGGGAKRITIANTSNTASSSASLFVQVAGSSAGDPHVAYQVDALTDWTTGIDNSDSDAFVISNGAIGTNNAIRIANTTRAVTLADDLTLSEGRLTATNTASNQQTALFYGSVTDRSVLQVEGDALSTGGSVIGGYSNSSSTNVFHIIEAINNNAAATGASCFRARNDSTGNAFWAELGDITVSEGKLTITDTANESAIRINASVSNEIALDVVVASTLTTGSGARIFSGSDSTSAFSLLNLVQNSNSATGSHCLRLEQGAANAFANFVGTAAANATDPISTLTTSGATTGHIQIDINGTKAWIAFSTTDPT